MHVPQGRGYVTRLSILVPARTEPEGAFNGVPSLQDRHLVYVENDVDWHEEVFASGHADIN
jgi:hypothetical protein